MEKWDIPVIDDEEVVREGVRRNLSDFHYRR